jgi:hypothetical protein
MSHGPFCKGGIFHHNAAEIIIKNDMELWGYMLCLRVVHESHVTGMHRGMSYIDALPCPALPFVQAPGVVLEGFV